MFGSDFGGVWVVFRSAFGVAIRSVFWWRLGQSLGGVWIGVWVEIGSKFGWCLSVWI